MQCNGCGTEMVEVLYSHGADASGEVPAVPGFECPNCGRAEPDRDRSPDDLE